VFEEREGREPGGGAGLQRGDGGFGDGRGASTVLVLFTVKRGREGPGARDVAEGGLEEREVEGGGAVPVLELSARRGGRNRDSVLAS
jgi:hypothetical protein